MSILTPVAREIGLDYEEETLIDALCKLTAVDRVVDYANDAYEQIAALNGRIADLERAIDEAQP